ncbi:phage tail tape measure protein [Chitiniphilus purpureus]|uniref:Phage tail tape measure protein n=1 Tax=Chitiniphilus purpureus TaxID=2981137 RepID=A0ABY6DQW8_9NEIS|nr:phage tail tape measure protein [Chitiniphilus sp. CD1]UXY16717.1 phage tail tape measure protein [Chitiniphilus sp. CD1]
MNRDLRLQVVLSAIDRVTAPLKRIRAGGGDAAKGLKAARDQLAALEKSQRLAEQFTSIGIAAGAMGRKLKEAEAELAALRRQAAPGERQLAALNARIEQGRAALDAHRAAQRAADAATRKTRGEVAKLTAEHEKNQVAIRAMRTGMGDASGVTDNQKRAHNELVAAQQRTLASLRAAEAQLVKDKGARLEAIKAVEQQRQVLGQLSAELGGAKKAHSDIADKMKAVGREVEKLSANYGKQRQDLARLKDVLGQNGITTHALGAHQLKLRRDVAAATAEIERQSKTVAEASQRMERLEKLKAGHAKAMLHTGMVGGAGYAMLAAGQAGQRAMMKPIGAYAEAEDARTQLRVSMMGANGKAAAEFAKIDALATKLGDRLPGTTADFQNMMTMLVRQGVPARNILAGVGEATALLGVQLKMAPDQAAEFTAKLQDATRTANGDMLALTDTIQRAFYLGVDPSNMLEAYKGLGPVMDMIKQKGLAGANAMAPFVVMMDQAGMRGESAGNAIRKVVAGSLNVGKIAKAQADLRAATGVRLNLDFTNGKGEFGGFDKMMKELTKLRGLNTVTRLQVLKDIYGDDKETNEVLSKIIEKGQAGYDDVLQRMRDQASLQQRVNEQLGTLKNLWEAASGTATNMLAAFGEAIAPELKALTEWIGRTASAVRTWAVENPRLAGTLMKVLGIAALLITALGGVAVAAASVLGPMLLSRFILARAGLALFGLGSGARAATAGLSLAQRALVALPGMLGNAWRLIRIFGQGMLWLGRALMLNPVGLAITMIAGAVYLLWRYWAQVDAAFRQHPILNYVFPVIGAARALINNWGQVSGFFRAVWAELQGAAGGGLSGIGVLILNWSPLGLFHRAFAAVLSWFGIDIPAKFTDFGRMLIDGLIGGINQKWEALKARLTALGNSISGSVKDVLRIRSPSRVFATIGGHTMAGLQQGLERNQQGPLAAVLDTARRLTVAGSGITLGALSGPAAADGSPLRIDTRPPLATQAGGIQIAGDQITIEIKVGPGQQVGELRQMLAQLLDEREHAKAARLRSALSDRD